MNSIMFPANISAVSGTATNFGHIQGHLRFMKLSIYMVMCWGTIIHIVENEFVIYFLLGKYLVQDLMTTQLKVEVNRKRS